MNKIGLVLLGFLIPASALAQGAEPEFGQFPSYIQMTATVQGVSVALRCGYAQVENNFVGDPGFYEMVSLNQNSGEYLRLQHIDNRIIVTTVSPARNGRFLLTVMGANGAMVAKECQDDPNTDQISGCVAANPTVTSAQISSQDQQAAQQCTDFFNKGAAKLERGTYNLQKTQVFKAGLKQKAAIIEGR